MLEVYYNTSTQERREGAEAPSLLLLRPLDAKRCLNELSDPAWKLGLLPYNEVVVLLQLQRGEELDAHLLATYLCPDVAFL